MVQLQDIAIDDERQKTENKISSRLKLLQVKISRLRSPSDVARKLIVAGKVFIRYQLEIQLDQRDYIRYRARKLTLERLFEAVRHNNLNHNRVTVTQYFLSTKS